MRQEREPRAAFADTTVPTVTIAIETRCLRQPLRAAFDTAARFGAAGVEIDARNELRPADLSPTGLRDIHKLLDDRNLRVAAVAFPTRRGFDTPDDLDRRVQAAQNAMRFAAELRCEVVVLRAGRIPETEAGGFTRQVEALTALAAYGDRVGVRPALQTADVAPADLARLLKALPQQLVGIDLHPSGLIMAGHSPLEAIETLGEHVLHVHACDAVRDLANREGIEVELGRGSADFPELLGRLTEFNYRGWVTVERRDAANPVAEIENAVAFLQSL